MKTWQKEMQSLYIKRHAECSSEILDFYIQLEKISKKYFKTKEMTEGDEFSFSITGGSGFVFKFYKDATEIYSVDTDGNNRSLLLSREDSYKKEYSNLRFYEKALKDNNFFIGERYPYIFVEVLNNIQPGQIISFLWKCLMGT